MTITVTKALCTDFETFKSGWEKDAAKPENTIMYYLMAALNIERDIALADAMMTVVVTKDHTVEDAKSPSGLRLAYGSRYYVEQFRKDPNIARSYVGGSPDNDYKYSADALRLTVAKVEPKGEDTVKIFIVSGGKDMPTPVTLARNKNNQWKLVEYSSICTGVKKPKTGDF